MLAAGSRIGPVADPTRSWWLANTPPLASVQTPPPEADIAIIGAGMTGCSIAYWLAALGVQRSVVVLDARGVAGGATGRNGGHLWCNPTSEFERATTAELLAFIEEKKVQCDLERGGAAALTRKHAETGVEYFDAPGDPEELGADDEWGEAEEWDEASCAEKLQSDAFVSAMVYPEAIQFFPAKVTSALLEASDATLVAPIRVEGIEESSGGEDGVTQLLTWQSDGPSESGRPTSGVLRAGRVVVATNGWASELLPELSSHLYATRNQVIMTAPIPASQTWQVGGLSVDSEKGARELYAIRRPDGRVCLGGARALEPGAAVGSTDDSSTSEVVGAYLRRFLAKQFPRLASTQGETDAASSSGDVGGIEVEAEWTGVLGFTSDGKPFVGPLPERPNVYVAAGFNGNGMPQCFGVGKAIALMLADRPQEVAEYVRVDARAERFATNADGTAG